MSQIDIIDAKKALATRLRIWGIEVDVEKKADGFIEDLVGRGWVMNPQREDRPRPPKREDQCQRCGGVKGACACTREHLAATYDDEPTATPDAHAEAEAFRAQIRARRERRAGAKEDA